MSGPSRRRAAGDDEGDRRDAATSGPRTRQHSGGGGGAAAPRAQRPVREAPSGREARRRTRARRRNVEDSDHDRSTEEYSEQQPELRQNEPVGGEGRDLAALVELDHRERGYGLHDREADDGQEDAEGERERGHERVRCARRVDEPLERPPPEKPVLGDGDQDAERQESEADAEEEPEVPPVER